jgi:hypothetical protein
MIYVLLCVKIEYIAIFRFFYIYIYLFLYKYTPANAQTCIFLKKYVRIYKKNIYIPVWIKWKGWVAPFFSGPGGLEVEHLKNGAPSSKEWMGQTNIS